jgi:glycosyltransferase involved in cell wall biosynthesis
MLLYMWPDIRKEYPDAELHICYGWKLFDMLAKTNPERRQWKASVEIMMQHPGVTDHGRLGKEELSVVRKSCGIWAYPTYFTEINCITALECQRDGVVPVTIDLAALQETVGAGVRVKGNIKDPKVMKTYLKELLDMMGDEKKWKKESIKGQRFTNKYGWETIAREWTKEFDKPISTPKVSVITPTIRTGFWNIMAQNLSIQTYKNFEWIIVDDHPDNRDEIARKYASLYNLEVRYLRGGKGSSHQRRCGLVKANNIGWQNAKGELLVWLQDFVLMPPDGLERLVDIYRHHPNDLIAPVDEYYGALPADKTNEECWWNGETKILTKKEWSNVRVKYEGMREGDNPFDYEANYGAIPRKVVEKLNGWWEFFDDGLGYDNTEICFRAFMNGSKLIVDDTNIAKCINIWPVVGGTAQNILGRERILNPPRYRWFINQMKSGKLPVVRDTKIDESIHLPYNVPDKLSDNEAKQYVADNTEEIIKSWGDYNIKNK